MNIFQYFEASGRNIYTDFDNKVTYFHRDGGAEMVPWDKSYKRWIGYSLLNFAPKNRDFSRVEVKKASGFIGCKKPMPPEDRVMNRGLIHAIFEKRISRVVRPDKAPPIQVRTGQDG
jgi:hypothetical protein